MICYRLKHKVLGLYYTPVRKVKAVYGSGKVAISDYFYFKSNFSKKGKVYLSKPNPENYVGKMYSHVLPDDYVVDFNRRKDYLIQVEYGDWVVEEVN